MVYSTNFVYYSSWLVCKLLEEQSHLYKSVWMQVSSS